LILLNLMIHRILSSNFHVISGLKSKAEKYFDKANIMKVIRIDKNIWGEGLAKLAGDYKVYGPAKNGENHELVELKNGEIPDLELKNVHLSAKSVVFPQSEVMFEYTLDESKEDHHIMREVEKDISPRAVIGIRPCDVAAFQIVKRNFENPEFSDKLWVEGFNACVFVGYACDSPDSSCFCTSTGSGPYSEDGLDVLLVDNGDDYLAKAITQKGEDLLACAGWNEETDGAGIDAKKAEAEGKITSVVDTSKLKDKTAIELFEAPFWEDVAFACLNCGTCTYSCPTCWCFDIQDEAKDTSGIRMRNWDSCMYPLFTLEGSGHNPRPEKYQRVRQRFMHKLKYYVDKYDAGVQCVGCGRCIRLCPVNIDIRNVCDKMNSYQTA